MCEVASIDLTSASKKKKKHFPSEHISPPTADARNKSRCTNTPRMPLIQTEKQRDELNSAVLRLSKIDPGATMLHVHPLTYNTFPKADLIYPPFLPKFYLMKDHGNASTRTILEAVDLAMARLVVSEEAVEAVEKRTRKQSESTDWFKFRAGRVTASKAKAVCRCDCDSPPMSLIKGICYPLLTRFSSVATR